MPKVYMDMDKFVHTNDYKRLKALAESQHLLIYPYEYAHGKDLYKETGSYLIVSPNEKYYQDLADSPEAFPRLVDEKRVHGVDCFNPCYQVIDVSNYAMDLDGFSCYMEAVEAIENASTIINAFRECGHDDYPDMVSKQTVDEIKDLNRKRHDTNLSYEVRDRFDKTFKTVVNYAHQQYMKANGRHYRPLITGQRVGEEYFSKNHITAVTDRINQYFMPYFMEQIQRYPDFYFALNDEKPAVELKGLDKLFKGKGKNPFENNKEITEWNITFPYGKRDEFYKILMEFNTRMYHGTRYPEQLGNLTDVLTMRINFRDMDAFDQISNKMGIKYYINHGDLEFMDAEATMKPLIAFNKEDLRTVQKITEYIAVNLVNKTFLSKEEVEKAVNNIDTQHEYYRRNNTIVGEPHDDRRKNFAASIGYKDLAL